MSVGIILAGGMSKRMGINKIIMPLNNKIMIDYLIDLYSVVCDRVIVVTGHYHDEIAAYLENRDKIHIRYNKDYKDGMYSSIQTGILGIEDDVFISPGDMPLVKLETLQKILDGKGEIRVPSFNNKLGHPIYLSKFMIQKLQQSKSYEHLKAFRDDMGFSIITTNDPGIIMDFDSLDSIKKYKGCEQSEN